MLTWGEGPPAAAAAGPVHGANFRHQQTSGEAVGLGLESRVAGPRTARTPWQVDGWISDWRRRAGEKSTAVGFAFELEGTAVRAFHVLVHGRIRPFEDVTTVEDVVRKLQVVVKVAQGRIVVVEPEPTQSLS